MDGDGRDGIVTPYIFFRITMMTKLDRLSYLGRPRRPDWLFEQAYIS
jgi:hypothetical protein